jgi:hypothetical protein
MPSNAVYQDVIAMNAPMSYNTIFSRAVQFVIRQPVVWILSFLIVFGLGNVSEREFVRLFNPTDVYFSPLYYPFVTGAPRIGLLTELYSNLVTAPVGLVMILALWLGGLVALAALIRISARAALGQAPHFRLSLDHGIRRAWRLVVVNLLVFGVFYGLILIYVLALVNSPTGKIPPNFEQNYWDQQIMQAGGQYSVSQITLCTAFPLNALAFIVYAPLVAAAILEDLPLWHSLRFGWRLLWANFGRLIGFWALLGGIALVIGALSLVSISAMNLLPADIARVFSATILIVSMLVSIFWEAIIIVAGVQFYLDCAHRFRSSQQSEARTQVAA